MILGSCIEELKKSYPLVDTSGFENVFRLNDGSRNAFVVIESGGYPKIFNREGYPRELLEKETVGIIERYCGRYDAVSSNVTDKYAAEQKMEYRILCRKRIQLIINAVIVFFFLFEVFMFIKAAGIF